MEDFTLAELGVFLGVVGGIFTSVLLTIQKSKCDLIECYSEQDKIYLQNYFNVDVLLKEEKNFEDEIIFEDDIIFEDEIDINDI